jgi:hypothetical protein
MRVRQLLLAVARSAGQMVTILLSNNGRQETYSFSDTNTTTAPGVLSCDRPPKLQK